MVESHFPTPGLKLEARDGLSVTLDHPIGAGAFGVVFQATGEDGTRYAVKFPQAGLFGSDREMQAFLNEVQAAKHLEHEHVLEIVAVETSPERMPPYLVMEFADGGTLKERLEEAKKANELPDPELIVGWAGQLVSGMKAINAEMLHRDLKTDNILFKDGTLKISDFGLSKLVSAATRTKTFKGGQHVLYMAPEAWLGKKNEIQVDMYALGIVLFEIATLSYPYQLPGEHADLSDFRDMHLYQAPRSIRAVRTDLPQRLTDAVEKLLSKRPPERYESWDDVAAALAGSVDDGELDPITARAIEAAAERHRQVAQREAEAAARKEASDRASELDRYQRDQLKEKLKALVDEFNSHSELVKISWRERGSDSVEINVPNGGSGSVRFFSFAPFEARPGEVRYGALVTDSAGCGYNLLLRRHPAGVLYGEWVVCRIRANPLTSRHSGDCKYFGLPASEIHEIPRGIGAMHVIIPEVGGDPEEAFREFLLSLVDMG